MSLDSPADAGRAFFDSLNSPPSPEKNLFGDIISREAKEVMCLFLFGEAHLSSWVTAEDCMWFQCVSGTVCVRVDFSHQWQSSEVVCRFAHFFSGM